MSFFDEITDKQAALLRNAPLFFVATADPTFETQQGGEGPINLSPKGGVKLHILDKNRVAWLDFRGSGNETLRHTLAGSPITLMVCSFEADNAAIIRLYGKCQITPLESSPLRERVTEGTVDKRILVDRQVIELTIDRTQTSCGYGVPIMEAQGFRSSRDSDLRAYKD